MTYADLLIAETTRKKFKKVIGKYRKHRISTSIFWGDINLLKNFILQSNLPIKPNLIKILTETLQILTLDTIKTKQLLRKFLCILNLYIQNQKEKLTCP